MAIASWLSSRTQQSAQSAARADGYTDNAAVFQFQRDIETGYKPDYQALRRVLLEARANPSMTLQDLHARYIALTAGD